MLIEDLKANVASHRWHLWDPRHFLWGLLSTYLQHLVSTLYGKSLLWLCVLLRFCWSTHHMFVLPMVSSRRSGKRQAVSSLGFAVYFWTAYVTSPDCSETLKVCGDDDMPSDSWSCWVVQDLWWSLSSGGSFARAMVAGLHWGPWILIDRNFGLA